MKRETFPKSMLACAALLAALVAPAYDNPLEVAVGSGESTLDLAQLSGRDAIVKTGGGTLVLPSIADFAGEIAILEGVVKVASEAPPGRPSSLREPNSISMRLPQIWISPPNRWSSPV